MWAYGHKDVVQSLLEHSDSRIDLNATTDYGRTALMFASQRGHQDIVQLFMSHSERIDLNAKDTSGWTAVKLAYSNGHEDVVQLFLDQPGSNISLNELKAFLEMRRPSSNPFFGNFGKDGKDTKDNSGFIRCQKTLDLFFTYQFNKSNRLSLQAM